MMLSRTRGRRSLIVTAALLAVAVTAVVFVGTGCTRQESEQEGTSPSGETSGALLDTITVTGTGKVTTLPDEAILQVTVENDADDAAQALSANSKDTEKVVAALKGAGIVEGQIETSNVLVYPNRYYDPQTGKETTVGYRAQNTITLTLKDPKLVGEVFATATGAGADNISGPTWQLSEDAAAVNEALAKAVENAKAKADALAAAQGVKVGKILILNEASTQQPYMYAKAEYAGGDGAVTPPPIYPENLEIIATVTATYRLER